MNRRCFLSLLGASVAGLTLEQAIPNGRVWSFPKTIKQNLPLKDIVKYTQYVQYSTGAFLVAELERLDTAYHEPLSAVTWNRDMDKPVNLHDRLWQNQYQGTYEISKPRFS